MRASGGGKQPDSSASSSRRDSTLDSGDITSQMRRLASHNDSLANGVPKAAGVSMPVPTHSPAGLKAGPRTAGPNGEFKGPRPHRHTHVAGSSPLILFLMQY